jgi:hypothetical protein
MSGFNLSPGITPLITDIAVAGFALSFGVAFVLSRKDHYNPALIALGINSIALSVFKIYTDYLDFWDVVLSIFILVEGFIALRASYFNNRSIPIRLVIYVIAGLVISFSLYKVISDFYDPYDLLQACCGIVGGALISKSATNV